MSCAFTMDGSKLACSLLVLIWKGRGCSLQDTCMYFLKHHVGTYTQETTYDAAYTKSSVILLIQLFHHSSPCSEYRLALAGMTTYKYMYIFPEAEYSPYCAPKSSTLYVFYGSTKMPS